MLCVSALAMITGFLHREGGKRKTGRKGAIGMGCLWTVALTVFYIALSSLVFLYFTVNPLQVSVPRAPQRPEG